MEDSITGKITIRIAGQPLEMEMTVPARPVKPQRMLPIFQQMASSFVDLSIQATEAAGGSISCQKGCAACCRQAVPLAEIEVYQIAAIVESMEEPHRSEIKKRFADGCETFHQLGWFERMENCANLKSTGQDETAMMKELEQTVLEYYYEDVDCPFLENESCSIHPVRPLVCREYLVTSPAENCSRPTAETIDKLELLVKPSKPLMALQRTEISAKLGFVPLIRALELAEEYPENFPEKPGQNWAADFFEKLTK